MDDKTKSLLGCLAILAFLWLCHNWRADREWQATREDVVKAHQGERVSVDTLKEIDKETSDIIQEGRDRGE